ncbi:helix-turn-helix transcriptional regulator [Lipingzhangella sp. LS1_29]|uniref:Helix-turn-helix transcriptional regulator n=1 Tax=Lipingzhangella rawalii TaxID=2055835 RepID=A0ABU2H7V9_9ACTN|nr:helix-turn-helix transcriptional regulator [Lipingzhangella rawalii]MDS1270905.1 helix-turn-helix transcriptional regulator [Lipingzhangella rawalii]
MVDAPRQAFSIADALDRLFRRVRPRDDAEYSYAAVAEAIRTEQGVPISHTYIWQLRTGRRNNPTIQHLTALATFFGVPVAYFLDEEEHKRVEGQLELLVALRNADVAQMALRAAHLSSDSREAMASMIRKVWELEHPQEADANHQEQGGES